MDYLLDTQKAVINLPGEKKMDFNDKDTSIIGLIGDVSLQFGVKFGKVRLSFWRSYSTCLT